MSVILRNKYGAIAVNKGVIEKMIIEDVLGMSDLILLCNKKGKLIKERPTPFIDPDYYDALEVSDKKGHVGVILYALIQRNVNVSELSERIFDCVESDFRLLRLDRPESIKLRIRGILSDGEIEKHSIEVVRNNA